MRSFHVRCFANVRTTCTAAGSKKREVVDLDIVKAKV